MTVTLERRYHVPRSQVWAGSGGRQAGSVHLHVSEDVTLGRFSRRRGEALCSKRVGWYEREADEHERADLCPECKARAARHGLLY